MTEEIITSVSEIKTNTETLKAPESVSLNKEKSSKMTYEEATDYARFLQQAQFTSTPKEIENLHKIGYDAWFEAEFNKPRSQSGREWLIESGHTGFKEDKNYFNPTPGDWMAWQQMLTGEDQFRKRIALALSEFFVVSLNPIDGFWPPYMIAGYWDMLCDNCFGNFRDLLEMVSLNPAMGMYLNTKGNLKEDIAFGRRPDENYAREIMQLFTIGLYELNYDGTLKLKNGKPIETYTQDDITNLARVFTGFDNDYSKTTYKNVAWESYTLTGHEYTNRPMGFNPNNHSNLEVNFLGLKIPAGTPGPKAFTMAHNHLVVHPNTAPFFCKQMIQRLVKSNPSPAYVKRVVKIFIKNEKGMVGDLKSVFKAILMDDEAAEISQDKLAGKLREPMIRYIQFARTFNMKSASNKWHMYNMSDSAYSLSQSPLRSPSVFNYFRPGYVPPQTPMAEKNLTAPEFQLHNDSSTAGYINFMTGVIANGYDDAKPVYSEILHLAEKPSELVEWLNLHITANQLRPDTKAIIINALNSTPISDKEPETSKLDRIRASILLTMASPDYLIQK